MGGEFFRGEYCPRDGHFNDTSGWVAQTVEQIRAEGARPSIAELVRRGFEGDLDDLMVVELRDQGAAPDWLRPEA